MFNYLSNQNCATRLACPSNLKQDYPVFNCLLHKARTLSYCILSPLKSAFKKRRHPSAAIDPQKFLHRLLLIGTLLFGAALLIVNAWFVMNAESGSLLMTPAFNTP